MPEPCHALGTGGEVQHGYESGTRAEPVEIDLVGTAQDHDDVLAERFFMRYEMHVRPDGEVVLVPIAHPGPDALLHGEARSVCHQPSEQGREEVPALGLLLAHPGEADRQRTADVLHLDNSPLAAARTSCVPCRSSHSSTGTDSTRVMNGSICSP